MRNKLISLFIALFLLCSCSILAFADETTTSIPFVSEPTSLAQSEVLHQSDVIQSDGSLLDELEHIDKHLDFFTTVTALVIVVFVIVVLWFVFGRWFFRY